MSSKTVDENYKRLRAELDERLSKDKRLTAIADKISKGAADFSDTARYTQIVSKHMSDVIKRNIGELKQPMAKEMVCKELLKENIERVDTVFGKVQESVDEKMGIHLNPVTPPYPTDRVNAIAHSLEDPNADDEKVARRGKSSGNVVAARHDENVKANAAWREKAGFDCYLVRDAGGGCCSWCAALEGRYRYADAPDDIFRRHDNCTCTVTYECGRKRQDVWSKKTREADPKDVEARKAASEASKPKVFTKEEVQAINEQSKPVVHTPAEAKELEQKVLAENPIMKNTPEQAAELEKQLLENKGNVNNLPLEKQDESGKMNTDNLKMSADNGFTLREKHYDVVENAKQVLESEKYAKEVLNTGLVDFKELKNNTVIQPMLEQINSLKTKHGKSFSQIIVDAYMSDSDFAMVAPDLGLHLNAKYMNSPEATADFLVRMKEKKLLPKGFENTNYITTHEYMHFISRSEVDNPWSKVHKVIPNETKRLKYAPSKNSLVSDNEYVADSMSMVELSNISSFSENKWNSWLKIYDYFFK